MDEQALFIVNTGHDVGAYQINASRERSGKFIHFKSAFK